MKAEDLLEKYEKLISVLLTKFRDIYINGRDCAMLLDGIYRVSFWVGAKGKKLTAEDLYWKNRDLDVAKRILEDFLEKSGFIEL